MAEQQSLVGMASTDRRLPAVGPAGSCWPRWWPWWCLLSKWLVLILLVALGLWPLTLLLGLVVLALISTRRGGWPWMKEWLSTRLRGLVVPALSVLTALVIGGLVLMFTDQAVYQALGDGRILARRSALAFGNLARAYGALYEGALGNPLKILQAIGRALSGEGLQPIAGRGARSQRQPGPVGALHLCRAGGGPGLSRRAVQHRRRGPDRRRLDGGGGRRLCLHRPAGVHPPAPGHRWRARWRPGCGRPSPACSRPGPAPTR